MSTHPHSLSFPVKIQVRLTWGRRVVLVLTRRRSRGLKSHKISVNRPKAKLVSDPTHGSPQKKFWNGDFHQVDETSCEGF